MMRTLRLAFPPGFYRNGPNYGAMGRWREGALVRFVDGKPRGLGGWRRRLKANGTTTTDMIVGSVNEALRAPRGIFSWRDNNGIAWVAIGLTDELWVLEEDGDLVDITPSSDFIAGTRNSSTVLGYGTGLYGADTYGTPRQGSSSGAGPVGQWKFDAWGEDLLAASPLGPNTILFAWSPGDLEAATVPNAPPDFYDFCVTNERIVMTVGGTANGGRGVTWSTREDRETWTPAVTNQAGSYVLPGRGSLIACARVGADVLVISETDAYVARYLGPPYIYGFTRVGENCGIISASSLIVVGNMAFWFNGEQFFKYDGGTVAPLRCDVTDFLTADINYDQIKKTYGYSIAEFNEVGWLYQNMSDMQNTNDPNSYVSYDYVADIWTTSPFERSVYMDAGIYPQPIAVRADGRIYTHELRDDFPGSVDDDDEKPYIRSGPIELNEGQTVIHAHEIILSELEPSSIVYIYGRDAPNAEFREYGPYEVTLPIMPVRGYGRELEIYVESTEDALWVLDNARLKYTIGGDR